MKIVIMFGLDHVEQKDRNNEASRLLTELAKELNNNLTHGTSVILKDDKSNRVGIADIYG